VIGRAHPCAVHRSALLDFVDRRERGPGIDVALEHLERCATCRSELEETALAIVALRRLRDEAERRTASPVAWSRLRGRLERPRTPAWQVRICQAALLASVMLVSVVVGTQTWRPAAFAGSSSDVRRSPQGSEVRLSSDVAAEKRLLDHSRLPVPVSDLAEVVPVFANSLARWPGPDGLGAPKPEVPAAPVNRAR
jgi:predicted anti-sigma-YlaC factor YlaD